jgi:hypothetical protein
MNKNTLLFYIHYGWGDIINMSGAVRYYSDMYKVTLIITSNNEKNARVIFDDIEDIDFLILDKPIFYKDNNKYFDEINMKYDKIIMTGYHDPTKKCIDIPIDFYTVIDLDPTIRKTYFKRKSIQNDNFDLIKKNPYVFIHTLASDKEIELEASMKTSYLKISPNKNYYKPDDIRYSIAQKFVDLPFFEYIDIIENAEELYLIDSSFFCICLYLKLKTTKKTCYVRYHNTYDNLDNTWLYNSLVTYAEKKNFLLAHSLMNKKDRSNKLLLLKINGKR